MYGGVKDVKIVTIRVRRGGAGGWRAEGVWLTQIKQRVRGGGGEGGGAKKLSGSHWAIWTHYNWVELSHLNGTPQLLEGRR